MQGPTMDTRFRRAAAALFTLAAASTAAKAHAQGAGQVEIRARDSMIVLRLGPLRVQMDSVRVLMSTLEQLPHDSRARAVLEQQIESLIPNMPGMKSLVVRPVQGFALPRGWIGINAQGPHSEFMSTDAFIVEYYDYPSIASVDPDSPAQRAGILAGDVLVGYNGSDVVGHKFDLLQMLVPERKLSVTVRRAGETKDYAVTVARAPENIFVRRRNLGVPGVPSEPQVRFERRSAVSDEPAARVMTVMRGGGINGDMLLPRRAFIISPNGAFGAVLSSVGPDLAKAFHIETGVLVNDVSDDTPASKAGLQSGDVIVSAAGEPVGTLRKLQEIIAKHLTDQSIALQLVRDRKTRKVTVSW